MRGTQHSGHGVVLLLDAGSTAWRRVDGPVKEAHGILTWWRTVARHRARPRAAAVRHAETTAAGQRRHDEGEQGLLEVLLLVAWRPSAI